MLSWKIYAWIFALINLYSLIVIYIILSGGYPFDLTIVLSTALSIGLNIVSFSYTYSKKISLSFIKTIFWFNILFLVLNVGYLSVSSLNSPLSKSILINTAVAYIPSIPALYISYKLIFKKTS